MKAIKQIDGVTFCGNCAVTMVHAKGKFCDECGPYERILEECKSQQEQVIVRAMEAGNKLAAIRIERNKAVASAALAN